MGIDGDQEECIAVGNDREKYAGSDCWRKLLKFIPALMIGVSEGATAAFLPYCVTGKVTCTAMTWFTLGTGSATSAALAYNYLGLPKLGDTSRVKVAQIGFSLLSVTTAIVFSAVTFSSIFQIASLLLCCSTPVAGILAATFALAMLVVQTCMCIRDIHEVIQAAETSSYQKDWTVFCKNIFYGVLGIDQNGSIATQICLKLSAFIVLFAVEYAVGMCMLKSLGTITASALLPLVQWIQHNSAALMAINFSAQIMNTLFYWQAAMNAIFSADGLWAKLKAAPLAKQVLSGIAIITCIILNTVGQLLGAYEAIKVAGNIALAAIGAGIHAVVSFLTNADSVYKELCEPILGKTS